MDGTETAAHHAIPSRADFTINNEDGVMGVDPSTIQCSSPTSGFHGLAS